VSARLFLTFYSGTILILTSNYSARYSGKIWAFLLQVGLPLSQFSDIPMCFWGSGHGVIVSPVTVGMSL
jgi:hypothetical protein